MKDLPGGGTTAATAVTRDTRSGAAATTADATAPPSECATRWKRGQSPAVARAASA